MPLDLTDKATIAKLERESKSRSRQDAVTLTSLMGSTNGRQFVLRKLEAAHIFSTTFSSDPLLMAFNEGQRNLGLTLLVDIMAHCPDQYILMMRERNERDAAIDRSLNAEPATDDESKQLNLYSEFDNAVAAGHVTFDVDDSVN